MTATSENFPATAGNGPTWRMIAVWAIAILVGLIGYFGTVSADNIRENAQRISMLERRMTDHEIEMARDIATIKTQLQGITQILVKP